MTIWIRPSYLDAYHGGSRIGRSQARQAYATYYCMDGSADMDEDIEERASHMPRPMIAYASRTGTRTTLESMRKAGWRLLVSAAGVVRTEGFRYALDNGAWSYFQQGRAFDELAFGRALELVGENADWVVVPDIVAGGIESLEYSLKWLGRLKGFPQTLLLAVQDGMCPDDVRELLGPSVGIFLGGSTEWKLKSMEAWSILARRRNCYLHVGRVNSAKRIAMCAAACANSFDGTSVTQFPCTLGRLDAALGSAEGQPDLFAVDADDVHDTPFDCRWPLNAEPDWFERVMQVA